jgi:hypothetical protein
MIGGDLRYCLAMKTADNISQLVGETPLVKIN